MGHVTRFRVLVLGLMVLTGLALSHQYAPPVSASGNCNIASLTVGGPTGSTATYCYGNNLSYGDVSMSAESAAGLLGPLDTGLYQNDYDQTDAHSGINAIYWWQRTAGEFRVCLWDANNQPDSLAIFTTAIKSGVFAPSNLYKTSSFRIISATFTCSNHPN